MFISVERWKFKFDSHGHLFSSFLFTLQSKKMCAASIFLVFLLDNGVLFLDKGLMVVFCFLYA